MSLIGMIAATIASYSLINNDKYSFEDDFFFELLSISDTPSQLFVDLFNVFIIISANWVATVCGVFL